MKKTIFISILIAAFATKNFAHCPIPQWCPSAPLHQILCSGEQIEEIEFPSVMGRTLFLEWWTDGTRHISVGTPEGISVSGTTTDFREYGHPVAISGRPTAPGTHHYTVSDVCGRILLSGSITTGDIPKFTIHPDTVGLVTTQDIAFCPDTLSVTLTGSAPITLQWYYTTANNYTTGLTEFGASEIATGSPVTGYRSPVIPNDILGVRYYHLVATNICGTVRSDISGLRRVVIPPPTCNPSGEINCDLDQTPVFAGGSLGTPYFRTSQVWQIFGNGISQEWSDVVLAPGCNHVTYSSTGNGTTPYTSACKWSLDSSGVNVNGNGTRPASTQAPGGSTYYGDYFSWCMVHRYADQLCPDNWRVPTCQDFINLDIALGGTGWGRNGADDVRDKLLDVSGDAGQFWGGAYVGIGGNFVNGQGASGSYQSSTEHFTTSFYMLYFDMNNSSVVPWSSISKDYGLVLRCVKDN
ncbi:MAG: fibrobacter succinogenes major paralogous domain-containing protein [Bacteroidales bacterium]|nr:fibrobacter succinogenes major paralogous domain-containing protein [Bacteroidales bacterium]